MREAHRQPWVVQPAPLHRCWLEKEQRLEEFALPIQSKLHDLKPNPNPRPGRCAVFERGLPCGRPAQRRGLCKKHYGTIWRRPDLDLEKFVRDEIKSILDRKKNVVEGVCLIRERTADGKIVMCDAKSHARGVCAHHYKQLERDPELMASVAAKPRTNDTFRLKKEPRPGICVAVQNNDGCTVPATGWRRLCPSHNSNFHRLGILHLTDQFRGQPPTLEKKKPEDQAPGACLLVVNGVGCRNVPKRRGICSRCLNAIEKQGLSLDGFGRPVTFKGEKRETIERKREIVSGVCVLVINGEPCRKATHARGLCRPHYRFLESRQELPRYALSEEELRRLPVVPHWYFDKNVVIDYRSFHKFSYTLTPLMRLHEHPQEPSSFLTRQARTVEAAHGAHSIGARKPLTCIEGPQWKRACPTENTMSSRCDEEIDGPIRSLYKRTRIGESMIS